jgi:hypothetical protein
MNVGAALLTTRGPDRELRRIRASLAQRRARSAVTGNGGERKPRNIAPIPRYTPDGQLRKGERAFAANVWLPERNTDPNTRLENFGGVTFSVVLTSVEIRIGSGRRNGSPSVISQRRGLV